MPMDRGPGSNRGFRGNSDGGHRAGGSRPDGGRPVGRPAGRPEGRSDGRPMGGVSKDSRSFGNRPEGRPMGERPTEGQGSAPKKEFVRPATGVSRRPHRPGWGDTVAREERLGKGVSIARGNFPNDRPGKGPRPAAVEPHAPIPMRAPAMRPPLDLHMREEMVSREFYDRLRLILMAMDRNPYLLPEDERFLLGAFNRRIQTFEIEEVLRWVEEELRYFD